MELTTNNNFLDNINPLDTNSSIHALAMLNGCTMQEYLEQLVSSEINHYDIQKLSNYRKLKFYFDQYYLKKYNLK